MDPSKHGCFIAASFFTHIFQASWTEFKEHGHLSNISYLCFSIFLHHLGFYIEVKSELVQSDYRNTTHFLFRLLSLYLQIPQCSKRRVFPMLC